MSRHALSRRTVLRGAGTAIALPLLDAMVTDSGLLHGRAHAASPVRLVTWFWPNGTLANKWDPTVVGNITAQNLSAMTQAFAPVAGKPDILPYLTFVSGVGSRIWMSGHSAAMMAAGQGGTDDHDNFGNWPTAATIDQVFASKHGANTRLPSMALAGTSTNTLGWGILSWKDGGRPITPFAKPLAVFDALFGAAAPAPVGGGTSTPPPPGAAELAAMRRKSVLDFVKAEAGRLN